MTEIDHNLYQYATEREKTILEALDRNGCNRTHAAKDLGIKRRAVSQALSRAKGRAAKSGYAVEHGMVNPYPNGYFMQKATVHRNAEGQVIEVWDRMTADQQHMHDMMRETINAMAEEIQPEPRRPKPKATSTDLLNCYVVTDYHLGMMAWHEETGADWDSRIAEDLLVNWFRQAIEQAPAAEQAVLCQLGDFLHHDGLESITPSSGHILDADTRFQKIVRVAIRALRRVIRLMLDKHEHVHIIMAEGNHDLASSVWLREWFRALYEDEPRITVDDSADPYYCVEWGETSLFFHHGHKKKLANVDDVFVAKFRDVFGRTSHSYGHTGHLHHKVALESNLMIVEQHRTLAAPDAYASRSGFLSGRSAQVITYHRRHGEVGRVVITADMAEEVA
jgi:hypothetical protein